MINGDGMVSEDPVEVIGSLVDENLESSDYSSCGESEFERYCSANSVMGSASLCSSLGASNDIVDLDFTLGFGESFSSSGYGRLGRIEFQNKGGDECGTSSRIRDTSFVSAEKGGDSSCSHELSGDPFDIGKLPDEISDCEHSDDASMFEYGTDDDHKVGVHERRYLQYHQESRMDNENPLLINSTVAFGLDDWNKFMQETEDSSRASNPFDKPGEHQHGLFETDEKLWNVASEGHFRDLSFGGSRSTYTNELKYVFECSSIVSDFVEEKEPTNNLQGVTDEKVICFDERVLLQSDSLGKSKPHMDPLSDISYSVIGKSLGKETILHEDYEANLVPSNTFPITTPKDFPSKYAKEENLVPSKMENLEQRQSYDEFVLEMEEILLDSRESQGAKFSEGKVASISQLLQPGRDGSSTASTSGTDYVYSPIQQPVKIDGIEVVGAKQKKGDVSLGERLVGVKEYTVYTLRVWSGIDQWEVERRYRDFYTLYRQLKALFADHGWTLPSPWLRVERESRKIFGNVSPLVVSERSTLIQECVRSILHSESLDSAPSSLVLFLSPKVTVSSPPLLNTPVRQPNLAVNDVSSLGTKISLLVEVRPRKSTKQLLEAQYFTCAGCRKHLDYGRTLVRELVQTFGWGSTRLCEYTGQLFCASCHTNETAVLPARVLHFWDFAEYPVSQLAKSYLDSIYDQPMLCVSAVNPFLFSKVPALLHVMGIRKKIGAVTPYLRCPFRRSILRGVGSRRYLLESNEFFALRDLVDLSKGAFSALPLMMETVSSKILEHITQQCLVCCDVAVPCCARLACEDPPSLIFPFQDAGVRHGPPLGFISMETFYPDEWTNFLERLSVSEDELKRSKDLEEELRFWASYRGHTLARTVQDMIYYHQSLELQAYLDKAEREDSFSKAAELITEDNSNGGRSLFMGTSRNLKVYDKETSFVTIGQILLLKPLRVQFHYGHPNVFHRLFHLTRGGIIKASKLINLSENIFASFNSTLREGNVTHHEYMQVGKGRDLGLDQISLFEEDEVERCSSCQSVFHKTCFRNLTVCGCGASFEIGKKNARHKGQTKLRDKDSDSESSVGFLSNLFSKEKLHEKIWGSANKNHVILMGALPSNSF
ncbi:hypothetical protein GIB67_017673 [Kingdonia uniflora]|uniref:PX domain-containing protein n=1 Tax=Kingdonia uniflora TaxID=39325 RepID=A0A7J7N9Z7_9MAGN|nr:hypothetical protein GIB67_017673 [Kingdonia uniflora]